MLNEGPLTVLALLRAFRCRIPLTWLSMIVQK